jgi:hypothetical protein
LARIDDLARHRMSFGFETTLASRSFAPWLRLRRGEELAVHLVFVCAAELVIARVARRVEMVGHSVTDEVVRRQRGWALQTSSGRTGRCSCTRWSRAGGGHGSTDDATNFSRALAAPDGVTRPVRVRVRGGPPRDI